MSPPSDWQGGFYHTAGVNQHAAPGAHDDDAGDAYIFSLRSTRRGLSANRLKVCPALRDHILRTLQLLFRLRKLKFCHFKPNGRMGGIWCFERVGQEKGFDIAQRI